MFHASMCLHSGGPSRSSVDERDRDRDRLVPKGRNLAMGAARAQVRRAGEPSCKRRVSCKLMRL
jgi:hypothetical protein